MMFPIARRKAACALAGALLVTAGCADPPAARPAVVDDVPAAVDVPVVGVDAALDAPLAADALAACVFGAPCPAGSQCYTTGCLPAIPLGGSCALADLTEHPCVFGSDCADDASGARHCVAAGSEGAYCNRSGVGSPPDDCDAGLACFLESSGYYRCRPGLRAGELCVDSYARCPASGSCCNAGTACRSVDGTARCTAALADNACGVCGDDASCVVSAGLARCVAHGAPGGRCREAAPRCDGDLRCDAPLGSELCRSVVALGGDCDAEARTSVCAEGLSCTTADFTERGRCVAAGTVAGADCRTTEPSCDGALRCSNFSRYRATCRVVASAGDACDLGGIRTLCPDETRCVPATGLRDGVAIATCTASVPEVEPNDAPAAPVSAVTRSTLYRGALSATDARDCFAVTAAEGASLYLETSPAGLLLSLFDLTGAELGRWVSWGDGGHGPLMNVVRLRSEEVGALRALRAGTYVACVSSPTTPVATYSLALGLLPPRP